jgi:hypothetical protein
VRVDDQFTHVKNGYFNQDKQEWQKFECFSR